MIIQDMETSAASDSELLAAWVAHRRESAFGSLVARYAALVHMAAKRTCGDDTLAADASQLVFILLAQKAKALTTHPTLAGWLHVTAVMKTRDLIDKAQRESRKRSHFSAAMETRTHSQTTDAWLEMLPVLDEALAALSAKDREALLLRFYRSLSVREIAETLGIATAAAQKRIDRATERLRGKLTRRGCQVGGSLSAALLAGFAADADAAALPVSLLTSKAIAAGAVSSFSLTAIITSIATSTLMKSTPLIPPLIALIVAGAWTGTKYQSLSAVEASNGHMREEIAAVRPPKTAAPVKLTKDDGPIDWKRLAAEDAYGPETRRFVKRLESMTREEMIDAFDRIAKLDCSKERRSTLESSVVKPLMQMDPEWVLNYFAERLRDNSEQQRLLLGGAFELWARKDLGKATAWFDSQITAGNFTSKQLDENLGSQTRHLFESRLLDLLLASDPAAAARRLGALPEKQRESVMTRLCYGMANKILNAPLTEGNHLAFANLVRSQLPSNRQVPVLAACVPYFLGTEEFPKFNAYMDVIEATPAERISCAEIYSGNSILMRSNKREVTLDDLTVMREQFAEISPQAVDAMTARSLAAAVKGRNSSMMFPQASKLAVELLESSGSDAVLATLLEIADFEPADKTLGRELAGKVSDASRRAEILKRFH